MEGVKSVKRPIKNVLIIGSYGASNIGDEEMLSVILKKLPENLGKFVLSGNIDDTKKQHPDAKNVSLHFPFGIRSFFSFRWIKSFSYLKKCDLVLFGGGGLFTDSHSLRAILLWSWQVFWASIYGKRIVFFGVSFGKLKSKFAKSLTTWAVKKSEKIYVRDKMSFQIIDKMGFREKVYLGSDLTFLKDINILNVPKRKILALNFREFKADLTVFSRFVEYAKREGYEILLTALENHDAELMKSMNLNLPIFQPGNFDNLIAKLAECEFVVGMRLHFLIAGVLAGCKVSGVSYDVKVGGVLNEMDIFSIGINEIKDEYFADLLYKAKTASHLEVVKLRAMQGWENFLSFLATK